MNNPSAMSVFDIMVKTFYSANVTYLIKFFKTFNIFPDLFNIEMYFTFYFHSKSILSFISKRAIICIVSELSPICIVFTLVV